MTNSDGSSRRAPRALLGRFITLPGTVRYGVAVGAALAAVLLRLAMDPVWRYRVPFILFYPVIMLSAWVGGLWPGVLTTVLCTVAAKYFWLAPGGLWTVDDPADLAGLFIFAASGVVISMFNEASRRSTSELERVLDERGRAHDQFRLAVEAAPAAMIMVDAQGTIVLANALTERLLGFSRDELMGMRVDALVPARFRERHDGHRAGFFADAEQRPMGAGRDLYALRKDGTEVPVEIGLSPIQTQDGAFVLAAVTDISDRKRVEEQRAQVLVREQAARAELEQASHLKDEFLAVLSHELRTPLNAVIGYAQLLSDGALPPDRALHALTAIRRNADAQHRLVESLLDLSRIIAGKLEIATDELDLIPVLEAAIDVVRPDAAAKEIAIAFVKPDSAMPVVGDAGRLQQVFWNLMSNAVKFTPPAGRISIRAQKDDFHARIEVADDGEGIGPDFLPHIFDRFKQARAAKRGAAVGLGLGLALVQEMVQAHGGSVIAQSDGEGRGSTFTVTLPLASARRTLPNAMPSDAKVT